jgi:cephalosporin hydroxylase
MDDESEFRGQVRANIAALGADKALTDAAWAWALSSSRHNYTYNFCWLGRPIIQFPQDIVAVQELIWQVKPDLVIETGIARGGSLLLSASILALLDYCEAASTGSSSLDLVNPRRRVVGIDIDVRPHNRKAIEEHPLAHRIEMIQGSSISPEVVSRVTELAMQAGRVIVFLDSNHTHEHVLAELHAYAPLVTTGSYCVVFDTGIEDAPAEMFDNRPWGPGNSPKTAVREYLKTHPEFEIDKSIQHKLLITVASDGYLKRIR